MKRCGFFMVTIATSVRLVAVISSASAQSAGPFFITTIPAGYRDWKLISVAHEEANLNSFAAVLGNDVAIQAYRDGTLPFPDGTIIAALHYRFVPSDENNKAFGQAQSFVAGDPTNVQFMIKDSNKYASTGGWGYGHFSQDGTPGSDGLLKTCAPCHAKAARDSVFTRYSR
jgi:Cytochrome P460